jgi:hypothetical protein
MYSESAQDIFDRLYDEYYTIIDQIKQWNSKNKIFTSGLLVW